MKRLLIGSCGGLTGIYLARQFKNYDLEILGADADNNSTGRFFVSRLVHLPSARSHEFIDELVMALNEELIDYYIPTHSREIILVSKYEEEIRKRTKTKFIVSPYSTYEALNQKDIAYENLRKIGIKAPEVYKGSSEAAFPAFFKKKVGSGSSGIGLIFDKDEFESVMAANPDTFICQYIQGKEYTVDCLFDYDSQLLGYNQRRRVKSIGGAVSITTNENEIDIQPTIKKMAANFKFCGCINFQYFLVDGEPYVTDVNLRFASGGLPLSVKSGVNVPEAYLRLFEGEKITTQEYMSDNQARTMYRYFEEIYEDKAV